VENRGTIAGSAYEEITHSGGHLELRKKTWVKAGGGEGGSLKGTRKKMRAIKLGASMAQDSV